MSLRVVDYTEKSIAVYGDTKDYKDRLKELGGKFNQNLKEGPGWIFSKKNESAVRNFVGTDKVPSSPITNVVSSSNIKRTNVVHNTQNYSVIFTEVLRKIPLSERLAVVAEFSRLAVQVPAPEQVSESKTVVHTKPVKPTNDSDVEDDTPPMPSRRLLK